MEEIQIFSFGDFDVPMCYTPIGSFLISSSITERMRVSERE